MVKSKNDYIIAALIFMFYFISVIPDDIFAYWKPNKEN